MAPTISIFIAIAIIAITIKFFKTKDQYIKILSFFYIFTNIIMLVLLNAATAFEANLYIIMTLFLLQLIAILFCLKHLKKQ